MDKNGKVNFHNYQQLQQNPMNNNIQINPNCIQNDVNKNQNINDNIYQNNRENYIPNNLPVIPRVNNINNNIYNNNKNNQPIPSNIQIYNQIQNDTIQLNQVSNIKNNSNNYNYIKNIDDGNILNQMRPPTGNTNFNNHQNMSNINVMPKQCNTIDNQNVNSGFGRINKISESKELKIKRQEEYRKELDDQLRQEIQRKERERQIKYGGGISGLDSLNTTNNTNINNYQNIPMTNNINNNMNNNNKDINMQDMKNNNNINSTITRPSINLEEKEKLRRKQMEYNQILRQQVEERNKRKEMEKQKEKEEEIKFEEKLKRQLIENQKRAELIKNNEFKNNKYAHNLESPENFMANPMSTMPIPQMNLQPPNTQNNNINTNYTTFPGFYGNNNSNNNLINIQNGTISMNNTNKYSTIDRTTGMIPNSTQNNMNLNNNTFNNNNPINYFNITPSSNTNTNTNNLLTNKKSQINNYSQKQPNPSQTSTAFLNTSKTNFFNNNINFPYVDPNKNSIRPISQQSQRKTRNDTWRMEELYMNFVQEQLKIINEYEININKYQNMKKDNFETIKDLMTIKNKSLEKIQEEQNKFKDIIGIYPMDNNFNNRVTNLMDMMLEKKINDIQRENKLEILANNINKQKKNNIRNIDNNKYMNNNSLNNENEFIPITESQINRNIIGCGYKSKYEELKNSMINGNEASLELRTSMSLEGFSKLVKQNKLVEKNENMNIQDNINNNMNENSDYENMYCNVNNGQSGLYTTWNSEKFPVEENSEINNINEVNSPLNTNEASNNNKDNNIKQEKYEIIDTTVNKQQQIHSHPNSNPNNRKLRHNRNNSKGILNDSQLPSNIIGNDKGLFNHPNVEMSGSNISMQESNSNINYINGSDLNIEQPFSIKNNSPTPKLKIPQLSENNNTVDKNSNSNKNNIAKNIKNIKLTNEEKDRSLLLVGDNVIKNNLTQGGYSLRDKENKEKSYLIGNITTINNNINDNTLNNNTNQYISANNTFIHMNTNTNNNLNKSQESDNKENENISMGGTIPSRKNGGGTMIENNETEEDMVRGFGPSGMNSMLNDENTSNYNHSNINNNSGMSNIMNKNTFGKKKGIVNNTNKEIQQIKEAEEKEEEENYAYDFTLDNKTLKKLEEEEKSQNTKKINLEDYKEIKESQKIQTQLNFFEDSVLENINISKSKGKNRVVKSYNMLGNKNKNIIRNLENNFNNDNTENNNNINSSSKKSNNTNNTNVNNGKRPQSPKYIRNNNINKNKNDETSDINNNDMSQISQNKNNINNLNENSSMTNLANDSYGDHIINDLNKYRKMFLEESSMD